LQLKQTNGYGSWIGFVKLQILCRLSEKLCKIYFEVKIMTNLSVNINKVATLRNARGENVPDVQKFAEDCERFGAQGITVHPRPDERHIKRDDVFKLRPIVRTEFNIEGYPSEDFIKLVLNTRPEQVTLVPDSANVLTSSEGWDVEAKHGFPDSDNCQI